MKAGMAPAAGLALIVAPTSGAHEVVQVTDDTYLNHTPSMIGSNGPTARSRSPASGSTRTSRTDASW